MMICSERTRGSREARPKLLLRAGLVLACLIGGLGVWTQPAAAQHVNYFWSVVEGSTTLLPGESVTLQLNAMRTPGFPETTSYAGGKFTVLISGWDASDALATNTDGTLGRENLTDTRFNYLGRKPGEHLRSYRNFPAQLGYTLQPKNTGVQELASDLSDQSIDHALGWSVFNPNDPANPNDFFRVQYTAGNSMGIHVFESAFTESFVGFGGIPVPATFTDGSITIAVVPSSSAVLILFLSTGTLWKRRR